MVEAGCLNWQKQTINRDGTGGYFYNIYVGGLAEGHICNYRDEEKLLSIAYAAYSSDDPSLRFKVKDINEASEIVKKFADGMKVDMSGTIYEIKKVLTDNSIMTFGSHKGKRLSEVPGDRLLFYYGNYKNLSPELKKYIEDNMNMISQRAIISPGR